MNTELLPGDKERLEVIDHYRKYRFFENQWQKRAILNPTTPDLSVYTTSYFECVDIADEFKDELEFDRIKYGDEFVDKCIREVHNRYLKSWRLSQRILSWRSDYCFFGTLTFTDEVLSSTTVQTRRKYVSRYLSALSNNYVANIDFGKTTEREHYHFIVDKPPGKWEYGFMNSKRFPIKDCKHISNYVLKYSLHSTKHNSRIIYGKMRKK